MEQAIKIGTLVNGNSADTLASWLSEQQIKASESLSRIVIWKVRGSEAYGILLPWRKLRAKSN